MDICFPSFAPLDPAARMLVELDGDRMGLHRMGVAWGEACSFVGTETAITVAHTRIVRHVRAAYEITDDTLLVKAHVNCSTRYDIDGRGEWIFRRPSVTVSFLPAGARVVISMDPEVIQTVVILGISPRRVLSRYHLDPDELPEPLRNILEDRHCGPASLATLPLRSDVSGLVRDLTSSRLQGQLRALQVEARCSELFALVVAAWNDHLGAGRSNKAHTRGTEIVAAARRILAERYANPPTAQALACELGTNKTKLNDLFQQATGVTLHTYGSQQRIERAQSLLMEGQLSLAQIATAVGYQHQSSFTAAFRDAVGMCPREYRMKSSCGVYQPI